MIRNIFRPRVALCLLAGATLLQLTTCQRLSDPAAVVENIQTFVTDFFWQAVAAYVV